MKRTLVPLTLAIFAFASGCVSHENGDSVMRSDSRRSVSEVLAENTKALLQLPYVTGVYEGQLDDGSECIKLLLTRDPGAERDAYPVSLGGYPVVLEVSGEIRGLSGDGG